MKNIKNLIIILLIILITLNINSFAYEVEEETDYIWVQKEIENVSANATEEPVLSSRYIAVLDRSSKKLIYGKSENTPVPMASTTKIMTT